jgi:hypothetical protein
VPAERLPSAWLPRFPAGRKDAFCRSTADEVSLLLPLPLLLMPLPLLPPLLLPSLRMLLDAVGGT